MYLFSVSFLLAFGLVYVTLSDLKTDCHLCKTASLAYLSFLVHLLQWSVEVEKPI
jgi:hypothetical protein